MLKVLGKEIKKENGECCMQCLEKPYGIRMPQDRCAFYEKVFACRYVPKLVRVKRTW